VRRSGRTSGDQPPSSLSRFGVASAGVCRRGLRDARSQRVTIRTECELCSSPPSLVAYSDHSIAVGPLFRGAANATRAQPAACHAAPVSQHVAEASITQVQAIAAPFEQVQCCYLTGETYSAEICSSTFNCRAGTERMFPPRNAARLIGAS
jgi:hypothetical protein